MHSCSEMISVLFAVFYVGSFLLSPVSGLAKWMTKEECKKPLRIGEIIMGSEAVLSTLREIRVYRNGDLVENGSEYLPGEELLVVLHGTDDTGIQFVYEATNAVFIGGGCDGHRLANSKASKLLMPSDVSIAAQNIEIIAGWSAGYETVKITPVFTLSSKSASLGANDQPVAVQKATPVKTNLRKQPIENVPPKPVEVDANVRTLSADHKVNLKHSSPGAFARTHPKLLSKLPAGSVEPASVSSVAEASIVAETNDGKLPSADVVPPASPPALLKIENVLPPASPPTGVEDRPSDSKLAGKEVYMKKEEPEAPTLKEVMDSMKEVSDGVHDRSKHQHEHEHEHEHKSEHNLHAPLKSPSKRGFLDSLRLNRPRHGERKPVKLEPHDSPGDAAAQPAKDSAGENNKPEKKEVSGDAKKVNSEEELPGADLSATEKRLRRSQLNKILLSGRGELRAELDKEPSAVSEKSAPVAFSAPLQTIFVMLFTGVLVFVAAVLFISVLMYFAGYKDDLSRMFIKLTRKKHGQDKE